MCNRFSSLFSCDYFHLNSLRFSIILFVGSMISGNISGAISNCVYYFLCNAHLMDFLVKTFILTFLGFGF